MPTPNLPILAAHLPPTAARHPIRSLRALLQIWLFACLAWLMPAAHAADWAQNFGASNEFTEISASTVDSAGNTIVAGYYSSSTLTLGSITLTKINTAATTMMPDFEVFVAKVNPAGTVLWATTMGGNNTSGLPTGVVVDASGNVYVSGNFSGSMDNNINGSFSTPAMSKISSNATYKDAFVIKLNSSGAIQWGTNFGGTSASTESTGIAVDSVGNVYAVGFWGNGHWTAPALSKTGGTDAFVVQLSASTGGINWTKSYSSADTVRARAVAVDANNNVLLTGQMNNSITTLGSVPTPGQIGTRDTFVLQD